MSVECWWKLAPGTLTPWLPTLALRCNLKFSINLRFISSEHYRRPKLPLLSCLDDMKSDIFSLFVPCQHDRRCCLLIYAAFVIFLLFLIIMLPCCVGNMTASPNPISENSVNSTAAGGKEQVRLKNSTTAQFKMREECLPHIDHYTDKLAQNNNIGEFLI